MSDLQPATVYSSVQEEYLAARTGAAVRDSSQAGRLRLTGRDRLDFMQRMSTNDMRRLQPGGGISTILTTSTGRIVDRVVLYAEAETTWMMTSPGGRVRDAQWLRSYIFFRDQVKIEDVSEQTAMLSVVGPHSSDLLARTLNTDLASLPPYYWRQAEGVYVARGDGPGGDTFDVWGEVEAVGQVRDRLASAGAIPLGEAAFDVLRIEDGWPAYGRELTEEINPHEARVISSVSFNKGCYIGQEVIARLDTYHKVQKYLAGLVPEAPLAPGMRLEVDGKDVGWVTSVAASVVLGRPVALAYVRTAHAEPGHSVTAVADRQRVEARVVTLPFTREKS